MRPRVIRWCPWACAARIMSRRGSGRRRRSAEAWRRRRTSSVPSMSMRAMPLSCSRSVMSIRPVPLPSSRSLMPIRSCCCRSSMSDPARRRTWSRTPPHAIRVSRTTITWRVRVHGSPGCRSCSSSWTLMMMPTVSCSWMLMMHTLVYSRSVVLLGTRSVHIVG